MRFDGARRWGAFIAVGLTIAGLVSGCAGRTDAATAVPPAAVTSGETALVGSSIVNLRFNPHGFIGSNGCVGPVMDKHANTVDILIANKCAPTPHPNDPWDKMIEMTFVDPTTKLMTKTVSDKVQVAHDNVSDLAIVTATLDEKVAASLIPTRISPEESRPRRIKELVALAPGKEVRGIVPSLDSAEFHTCKSYFEVAQGDMKLSPNWFYFYSPANGGMLKNDQGIPLFSPETQALAAMVFKTVSIDFHLPRTGYDCSIAVPVEENAIKSLLAKSHPEIANVSR